MKRSIGYALLGGAFISLIAGLMIFLMPFSIESKFVGAIFYPLIWG